jgi:WD40 repeat protein/serine/threonine protein kinase
MAVADVHPSVEELLAFSLGTLGEETKALIEAHVAACTSCQERAANAPGDSFVELLRRTYARTSRGADTFVDAAEQVQTPVPPSAVAGTEGLPPAVAPSAPAESGRPQVPDAIPPELAHHERYRVVRLLGTGGMGAVYEAEHLVMRRRVAVKVIKREYTANADALERFRREVRNAARLSHPNIVTTYDAEDAGETRFLVMEYVEGTDLGRLVQERGLLAVDRACDYARQAALGLQYAFEQCMVHRDLKPHNLMVTCLASGGRQPPGPERPAEEIHRGPDVPRSPEIVKILDFGLAHFASEAAPAACRTGSGIVLGTVDYIAPEQADSAHQADIRSDIYSLGCTLYHLLAGQPPFPTGTPIQKVMAHREKPPQPLTELRQDIPEELMHVIDRMMAKKPERRYQTPAEVAIALQRFTTAPAVAPNPKPSPRLTETEDSRTFVLPKPPAPDPGPRRIVAVVAALMFVVAGLLGAAVYRVATDKGELVIETESDDVKVVITQGGKLVDVIDTKTDKQISLALRSGEYELALKQGQEGLRLSRDKMTLKRGETVVATVTIGTPGQAASKYLILPIDKVTSAISTKSLWSGAAHERLIFPTWGKQEVFGIPFDVIDPKGDSVKNAIVLYGPLSPFSREMPLSVRLKCGSAAKAIHLLGGVSGWGWWDTPDCQKTISMIVRLRYQDGGKEEHELINGVHFCDPNYDAKTRLTDVPGSRLAMRVQRGDNTSHQIRYLAIQPKHPTKVIEEIEFIKGMKGDITAPVIMAVTVERPVQGEKIGEQVDEVRRFEGHTNGVFGVALSPDGRHALSGGGDGTVLLWEVATGREVRRFSGDNGAVDGVAFSPDGRQALTASIGGTVRLWDVLTGKAIHVLKGHTRRAHRVAFSPDGRLALSGGDETMRLWDLESGKELRRFAGWAGVAFSPDGRRALSGGNPLVRLWDVETGAGLRELRGHTGIVTGVVFLPGGRQALSCSHDGTLRLWDLDSGQEIRCFSGHTAAVQRVAITRDGKFGLSGSDDKTVRLWDLQTGKELHCFTGHTGGVLGVAVSPDGKFGLSSGGDDNTVILWRLPDLPPANDKP